MLFLKYYDELIKKQNANKSEGYLKALSSNKHTYCISSHMDETASVCNFSCAESNALESWQDHNSKGNHFSLSQPTIRPLYNTASFLENLLVWNQTNKRPENNNSQIAYNAIQNYWSKKYINWNIFVSLYKFIYIRPFILTIDRFTRNLFTNY